MFYDFFIKSVWILPVISLLVKLIVNISVESKKDKQKKSQFYIYYLI